MYPSPSYRAKVERSLELRSSAEEIFNVFAYRPCDIPTYAPDLIQSVDVQGDTQIWKYIFGGRIEVVVSKAEVDAAAHTVTYVVSEGDPKEVYKEEVSVFKFTPKGEDDGRGGSIFHLTIETEKRNVVVLPPDRYADYTLVYTLKIDAAIYNAKQSTSDCLPMNSAAI